ncbi:MAG: T9SS type A sorting domain-containing protein [Flavobacteriales bacterium]|jgi:hypothetical protein|nr:T9SS type A sorting domain-containing protein [Flavobacteriales bacterium]
MKYLIIIILAFGVNSLKAQNLLDSTVYESRIEQPNRSIFPDFDTDGDLDIVQSSTEGTFLMNHEGDFYFKKEKLVGISNDFQILASSDFDEDGKLDFLGSQDSTWIIYFQGNNLNFTPYSLNYKGAFLNYDLLDINGDNKDDILLGSDTGIVQLTNNGNQTFSELIIDTQITNTPVKWHDMNTDGTWDILCTEKVDSFMYLQYLSNANSQSKIILDSVQVFANLSSWQVDLKVQANQLFIKDIDYNGSQEFILVYKQGLNLNSIIFNYSNQTVQNRKKQALSIGAQYFVEADFQDYNNDSLVDIYLYNHDFCSANEIGTTIGVMDSNWNYTFTPELQVISLGYHEKMFYTKMIDFDQDGEMDIYKNIHPYNAMEIKTMSKGNYQLNKLPQYREAKFSSTNNGNLYGAEVNERGQLIFSHRNANGFKQHKVIHEMWLYGMEIQLEFKKSPNYPYQVLVLNHRKNYQFEVRESFAWRIDGNHQLQPISLEPSHLTGGFYRNIYPTEFNNDGMIDFVAVLNGKLFKYQANNIQGGFIKSVLYQHVSVQNATYFYAKDLNGDGWEDIIYQTASALHILWMNNGAVQSSSVRNNIGAEKLLAIADYDHDGNVDLLRSTDYFSFDANSASQISYSPQYPINIGSHFQGGGFWDSDNLYDPVFNNNGNSILSISTMDTTYNFGAKTNYFFDSFDYDSDGQNDWVAVPKISYGYPTHNANNESAIVYRSNIMVPIINYNMNQSSYLVGDTCFVTVQQNPYEVLSFYKNGNFVSDSTFVWKDILSQSSTQLQMMLQSPFGKDSLNITILATEVGIDENDQQEIDIYPNPTHGVLHINSDAQLWKRMSIHGMSGKLLMQSTYKNQWDISQLSKGVYFLKLSNGSKSVVTKIQRVN